MHTSVFLTGSSCIASKPASYLFSYFLLRSLLPFSNSKFLPISCLFTFYRILWLVATIVSGQCVWIMVISHSKTLLCRHGILGSNTPLHERRVWQYKCRIVCANILNGYNKLLILLCVSWPVCLSYKCHDGSVY